VTAHQLNISLLKVSETLPSSMAGTWRRSLTMSMGVYTMPATSCAQTPTAMSPSTPCPAGTSALPLSYLQLVQGCLQNCGALFASEGNLHHGAERPRWIGS